MLIDILQDAALGAGYIALVLVLLVVNHYVIDVITPGHLISRIVDDRSFNGAAMLSAAWVGQGYLAYTTIINTQAGVNGAVTGVLVFGVLTILVHAVVIVGLNLLSRGRTNRIITEPGFNPGALLVAAALLAVSIGASAAITP
ncbi:DUF350 domain-containing protein [Solicola sp. PLA-1-18]|uniref:DUF350 domain-containing protein n=1 Tax=Solicola sp. PLA-1-18 TaxID=3380532 RepID=UPI003B77568E